MQPKFIISEEQSKRLNILKLLMAIFVVYIHAERSNINFSTEIIALATPQWFELLKYAVSELIPRCATSCFFLMASILLYRKDYIWKDNIVKKCKSLLVPYVIMNTVWIVIFAVCQSIPQIAVFFRNPDNIVADFSVYKWFQAYGIGHLPFLDTLWFVRNLFILNILASAIKLLIDRFPNASVIAIVTLFFLSPAIDFPYLQIVDLSMWCFGYLIVKHRIDINYFDKNRWIPIIYVITIIICLILKDISIAVLTTALYRFRLVISIIFWYSCFTRNFNGTLQRLFQKYSKYHFGIYLFFEMTMTFAIKIIAKVFGTSISVQVLEYMLLPLTIVTFAIILCIILKRVAPKVLSLLTGARVQ